jgi:hypothetical protein
MRSVIGFVVAVALGIVPFVAAGQAEKPSQNPSVEAEAHQQTITVKPAANGCAVSLSTKVGKALGTPEGLGTTGLGETGQEPLGSIIACQCGTKVANKECPRGGSCTCSPPDDTPLVMCN